MTSAMTVQVNDFAADAIISQLLLLDSQDPSKVPLMMTLIFYTITNCPESHAATLRTCSDAVCYWSVQDIKLFINSPGGSVTAGMGIYDAMQVA